jgi:hypothetical protein
MQGTSGALSHSASLAVAIQSAVNPALPRTAFARTDSVSASQDPFREPHHLHIAYDPANKHLFVANRAVCFVLSAAVLSVSLLRIPSNLFVVSSSNLKKIK